MPVFDLPLSHMFDVRPWRCLDHGCQKVFPVLPEDICAALNGTKIYRCSGAKQKDVYFTALFLLTACVKFFEVFNAAAVKRFFIDYYVANSLVLGRTERRLWLAQTVPRLRVWRRLLIRCLSSYLPTLVRDMKKHVHVYSGSGVRGDGNYKIAVRIAHNAGEDPISVIYAWCGVDGALLEVPHDLPDEKIDTVLKDLDPIADQMHLLLFHANFCLAPNL